MFMSRFHMYVYNSDVHEIWTGGGGGWSGVKFCLCVENLGTQELSGKLLYFA